jgi:hypothetical protein
MRFPRFGWLMSVSVQWPYIEDTLAMLQMRGPLFNKV